MIDFLSDMTVGRARTPRMATLRTIFILFCQSQSLKESNLYFFYLFIFVS